VFPIRKEKILKIEREREKGRDRDRYREKEKLSTYIEWESRVARKSLFNAFKWEIF
jgi:hypothetical protein